MNLSLLALPLMLTASLPASAQVADTRVPASAVSGPAVVADCHKLLEAYRQMMLEGQKPDAEAVRKSIDTLTPEGKWTDIDYADQTLSNWKPLRHLSRVSQLYLALRQPDTLFSGDARVKEAAQKSLNWWLYNKPKESQWYHLNISVPRHMRDIILLAGDDLKGEELELAMKQLAQFKVSGTGANLVWSADLAMHYAALRFDGETVSKMAKLLADEVKVSNHEGIRDDWSFHQHGARLQTFHYGQSFFSESTRIAWQLRDTRWAYPDEKIQLLSDLASNGWVWQLRGNITIPSTLDRAVSRPGQMRLNLQKDVRRLAQVRGSNRSQLEELANAMDLSQPAVQGFRWFPRSDFAAYQTPRASFFLKTVSTRTLLTESINNENQLGAQLNIGDHYILKRGDEYLDLMGAWDWKHVPGVTWPVWASVSQPNEKDKSIVVVRKPFSGAVTDGRRGAVAWEQEIQSKDKTRSFSVRKATYVQGDTVISLWSDMTHVGDGSREVITTLEQNRWRGVVWGGSQTTSEKLAELGVNTVEKTGLDWVNHNGTGYIALQPGTLSVSAAMRENNWNAINKSLRNSSTLEPVFTATIQQDGNATQGGYVILLDASPEQTRATAANPSWTIEAQEPDFQNVTLPDDSGRTEFSVVFAPGKVPAPGGVNRACLLLRQRLVVALPIDLKPHIWASDPLHVGGELRWGDGNQGFPGSPPPINLPRNGNSICGPAMRGWR